MPDVTAAVAAALGSAAARSTRLSGGDINRALRLDLADGRTIFVKHHDDPPAGMFAAEARGLAWLAVPDGPHVPRVLAVGDTWLALDWLDGIRPPASRFAPALGRALAALHAAGAPCFGLDHDNFIAVLPQDNRPTATFEELWIERRLRPLVVRSKDAGWSSRLDRLHARWADIAGPDEPPSRLHGDLWSGNVHAHASGPAIIDPAVYGGHREVDLAMLALFGGLDDATVAAYHERFPLADGWRDRAAFWQLYPLLVHHVLFGGGYGRRVDAIFRAFT
jgi:fructosamine-3-kinase